mgnify:CR=1 FL=1
MKLEYVHIREALSEESLKELKDLANKALLNPDNEIQEEYGRVSYPLPVPDYINDSVTLLVNGLSEKPLTSKGAMAVTYSLPYGTPDLPPHYDGDDTDMIVSLVLSSNTRWIVGLDKSIHNVLDNGALIFNPNDSIHWRSHKEFQDGEYVTMVFFRFHNKDNPSDYSHRRLSANSTALSGVNDFRNKLNL